MAYRNMSKSGDKKPRRPDDAAERARNRESASDWGPKRKDERGREPDHREVRSHADEDVER